MPAEIQIQQLFKKYPNGTQALKGVSIEIHKGQFFTLLGSNGAGKQNPSKIQNIIGVASQDNEIDPSETKI